MNRAPRLGPEVRLAPHVTRHGRFRKLDPARPRPLPSLPRLLAGTGWLVLVVESFRRARRTAGGYPGS